MDECIAIMREDSQGGWVSYEDYKRMLRNKSIENISWIGQCGELTSEVSRLKERVAFLERADRFEIYNHESKKWEKRFSEPKV